MKISCSSYISNNLNKTFKNNEKIKLIKVSSDGIHYDFLIRTFDTDLKINHLKQKLFAKKEESNMQQSINNKAEKIKGELKQKGEVVLKWVVTLIYLVLLIYFVFKPLTEFMCMVEYNIKIGILNYFIK